METNKHTHTFTIYTYTYIYILIQILIFFFVFVFHPDSIDGNDKGETEEKWDSKKLVMDSKNDNNDPTTFCLSKMGRELPDTKKNKQFWMFGHKDCGVHQSPLPTTQENGGQKKNPILGKYFLAKKYWNWNIPFECFKESHKNTCVGGITMKHVKKSKEPEECSGHGGIYSRGIDMVKLYSYMV